MALENRTQAKFLFLPYSVPSCRIMGGLHQALIMLLGYDCLAFVCCFTAIDLLVKNLVVIANANRQQKECHKVCPCLTPFHFHAKTTVPTRRLNGNWMLRKEASLRIAQNSTLALDFTLDWLRGKIKHHTTYILHRVITYRRRMFGPPNKPIPERRDHSPGIQPPA